MGSAGTLQWLDLSDNVCLELDEPGVDTLCELRTLSQLALRKPGLPKLGIIGSEQVSACSRTFLVQSVYGRASRAAAA